MEVGFSDVSTVVPDIETAVRMLEEPHDFFGALIELEEDR